MITFKTASHLASIFTHAARVVRKGSTLKSAREYMFYQLITRVESEGLDVGANDCTGAYSLQGVLRSKADFLAHCDREAIYWNDLAKEIIQAQRDAKAKRDAESVKVAACDDCAQYAINGDCDGFALAENGEELLNRAISSIGALKPSNFVLSLGSTDYDVSFCCELCKQRIHGIRRNLIHHS